MKSCSVIVFDLDDTLLDTSRQLVPGALKDLCTNFKQFNITIDYETCLKEKLDLLKSYHRIEFIEYLVNKWTPSDLKNDPPNYNHLLNSCYKSFYNRDVVEDIYLSDETNVQLERLSKGKTLYLVTAGSKSTQTQKVNKLQLKNYFKKIYYMDHLSNFSKAPAFQEIYNVETEQHKKLLSIGNRLDTDIAEAKKLKFTTCHIKYGEYKNLIPQNIFENPDFTFTHIEQALRQC